MTTIVPMPWEEFDALGESLNEYIDGALYVNASPRRSHQVASARVRNFLDEVTPDGFEAIEGWSWKPGAHEFIPDIMLVAATDEDVRYTGVPELVVEILSSDRGADLVVKARTYAEAGLQRFLVVDVPVRTVTVFELVADLSIPRCEYRELHRIVEDEAEWVDLGPVTVLVSASGLIAG